MKKVLTVGVFDLLHIGHVNLLKRAKEQGDYLIVAVQNSDVVAKFKPGAGLVCSTEERMYLVKALRYVDEVVEYDSVDKIVHEVDFDILVTGPDQNHSGFVKAMEWCAVNGKEVVVIPRTEGVSSSWLKEQIKGM